MAAQETTWQFTPDQKFLIPRNSVWPGSRADTGFAIRRWRVCLIAILAKEQWLSESRKVTAGPADSNGSLPPVIWRTSPAGRLSTD